MFNLTGKSALITGATGGIGWAIAEALNCASCVEVPSRSPSSRRCSTC